MLLHYSHLPKYYGQLFVKNRCHDVTDEKEKYDPAGFRDFIVIGLNAAGPDVDAIWKFLDSAGSKVDYRRYGEALFDILIAGGLLGRTAQNFIVNCSIQILRLTAQY